MSLFQDLGKGYLDTTYGVVSNVTGNDSCDNYHLFTAEAMLTASWSLWPQYAAFYRCCEIVPGLITRYPGRVGGGISQDEMIGAATLLDTAAENIYNYGQRHHWYFNPDGSSFTLANWFGRFIDFPPYIRHMTGRPLDFGDQIMWALGTLITPLSSASSTSSKLLKWVQLRAMKGKYKICDLAIDFYMWRMKKQYSGLKEVFSIYFGPMHPLTLDCPDGWLV